MIDQEYSEIKRIDSWKQFRKEFKKDFLRPLKIRRFWQNPNEPGYQKRYYKDFEDKKGENKYIACLIPSRTNLSTKTGISEVEKTEGLKDKSLNYILITDLILLNNEGEKGYTDLVFLDNQWCRTVINQRYNIVIPHFEYQLEGFVDNNIKFIKDE